MSESKNGCFLMVGLRASLCSSTSQKFVPSAVCSDAARKLRRQIVRAAEVPLAFVRRAHEVRDARAATDISVHGWRMKYIVRDDSTHGVGDLYIWPPEAAGDGGPPRGDARALHARGRSLPGKETSAHPGSRALRLLQDLAELFLESDPGIVFLKIH